MKRKVKAQRKFAQGTIVPAVNNMNINLFPKNDTGTTPQEENIIVNKMSARNLLDIISIQGVLPQLKERPLKSAYVRIERLNSKKAANEKNQRKPGPSPIIKTPVELNSEHSQSKRTITLRRFSKYSGVALRSRVHKNIKNNKSKTTPQTFRTSNRTITKNKCYCSLHNRSHDSVCSSVCMDDDDKPLIAFTKIGMNGANGEKSPLESASCNGASTAQCYGASNPRTLRNTETKTDRRLRRMSGLIKFDRTPKQPLNKAKASTDVPPGTASISPKEKAVKSPQATVKSPQATAKSPQATVKSPQATVKSPQATVKSPQSTVKSLQAKVKSPQATVKSPQATVKSPQATVKSPQATVKSPQSMVKSPQAVAKGKKPIEKRRSKDIVTPKEKLLRKKSALLTAKRFRGLPPTSSESLQTPQAGLSNAIMPGLHVCASPIPDRSDAMPDDEDLQSESMEGQSIYPTLEALKESIAKKEESRAGRVSPQSAPSYSTYLEYGGENASPVTVASNAHTRQDVQESASPQTEPLQVYKMPARSSPQHGSSIASPRPKRTRTATKNKLQAKQNTRSATASKNPSQIIDKEIESPITFQEIQPCVMSNNDSVNANLEEGAPHTANISSTKTKLYDTHNIINWIDGEFKVPDPPSRISTSRAQERSSAPKENDVDVYSTASTCASERYSSVLDVAQAPEAELGKGCGSCSCCRRVNKALQLKSLLQRRLMTPDIYEFDGNDEQEGLQPFRSSREEGAQQTGNSENVYTVQCIHSWEHDNELFKIIITERDGKKRCTAYRVPRSSTKNIRNLLLIEDELAIDQMVDYLSAESEQIQPNPDKSQENTSVDPEPTTITPIPKPQSLGKVIDAIVYRPTEAEFLDPLAYFEKIMPTASKFGICKVIPPPGFKPDCKITNDFRFTVTNQYLARLYCRWGPVARETAAIKAYLATQAVYFSKCPLIDGLEVDLPKFYHTVQRQGGLQTVIQNKCWDSVAEEMLLMNNITNPDKKLDNIYVKYLVPYTYLSDKERNEMIAMVEKKWNLKYSKMLERARNPLHRQKRILQESESSDSESEYEDNFSYAINEAEECVVSGRKMTPGTFKKFAGNIMRAHYPAGTPTVKKIEEDYWRYVICGVDHVCVNSASIDTGEEGYGFTKIAAEPYGKHPWNLKMLSRNDKNVLRSLGPILGVTVPTLHVNMLFSTSCWHSDPQGLPWVEYHHQGAPKIWYGIPSSESEVFRAAVEKLCPYSCQNKSIWLPSDITMIPPNILCENKVSLSRVEQHPGEFIIVFPKAYSCSISTGYAISESVYFATNSWLNSVHQVYQELRDSSEPTMFPLEHLLLSVAQDPKTPISILQQVHANLIDIVEKEFDHRLALQRLPARVEPRLDSRRRPSNFAWNVRDLDECEICKTPLYLAKVLGITGKREPLCLEHAKRILNTPHYANIDLRRVVLIIYFSTQELNAIVEKVRKRLLT